MMRYYQFRGMLLKSGWMAPAWVGIQQDGFIGYLSDSRPEGSVGFEFVDGYAVPGFLNAHSHAFQYAMAGMAEQHPKGTSDDFWSWREAMYKCALSMDPDQMQAVATMLYAEMLRKGYTHVAEFHYLHHDRNGKPYSNLAEMGNRLVEAARETGIRITLIPVFYQKGGFGAEPQPRQRRFISKTIDDYFSLFEESRKAVALYQAASLGFSVHSLRAVNPDDIVRTLEMGPTDLPFHIHTAEQLKEVEDCMAALGQRPVEWALNNLPVSKRFHMVHCTHLDDHEVERLAKSNANAVLCPGTEGNLGDGIFRLSDFYAAGGNWSIGTDSHISLNPLEDLRWLDYAQRLTSHKRNTFDDGAQMLFEKTFDAGCRAMGNAPRDYFLKGVPLDAVVFNAKSPLLSAGLTNFLLPQLLYNADSSDIYGTIVNGQWVVKEQRHRSGEAFLSHFQSVMKQLSFEE